MAGPTMRPTLNTMALMPSALVTSARSSTIKRIKVCRTGISKALAMPISEAMARYAAKFITPAAAIPINNTENTANRISMTMSVLNRGNRSAASPPKGPSNRKKY